MDKLLIFVYIFSGVFLSACGNAPAPVDLQSIENNGGVGVGRFSKSQIPVLNQTEADQGKLLYEKHCMACHSVGSERKLGPGLKGITERRKPQWILNMMANTEEMLMKDPDAIALMEKYGARMITVKLEEKEYIQLLQYMMTLK